MENKDKKNIGIFNCWLKSSYKNKSENEILAIEVKGIFLALGIFLIGAFVLFFIISVINSLN